MATAYKKDRGPAAVDLIEEGVHLLRAHPRELAAYYATSAPFCLGLVYFWGNITWFTPSDGEIAAGALALALLFGLMKAGHRNFALSLMAIRGGEPATRVGWRSLIWSMAEETRLHASGPIVLGLAALFAVPLGWAYAYYQSATALPPGIAAGAERRREAWKQAELWPVQNHVMISILGALWLVVFLNIGAAFYLIPNLATQWLGLDTVFAMRGWAILNTTFLTLVAMLTQLAVDPLVKACYVLRVFYGRARTTGADLQLVLRRERAGAASGRRAAMAALLFILLASFAAPTARADAEANKASVDVVPRPDLDRALDEVFEQPDFRWRLRPTPPPPGSEPDGIVSGFFRTTVEMLKEVVETVGRWFRGAWDWFSNLFPGNDDDEERAGKRGRSPFDWMAALQLAAIVMLIAVVGLLIFVAWRMWQQNRAVRPLPAGTVGGGTAGPDLQDDSVQASQLPADGWLALAREKMAGGEWRLALRALFLATLAQHAHEGLVSLARSKTNLDYETELRRRARDRTTLVSEFRGRRRLFEDVWYGSAPATDADVRSWLQRLEGRP